MTRGGGAHRQLRIRFWPITTTSGATIDSQESGGLLSDQTENLNLDLDLPPSPPPLPPLEVDSSTPPESGCENLNPPLSSQLTSFLPHMLKPMVSESRHDIDKASTSTSTSNRDEIPSEHESFSVSAEETPPGVLLSETVPSKMTNKPEPPLKKSRTMHYTPDRSTKVHQLNVHTDPLISGAAVTGLTRGEELDASKSDHKDSSDRPSTAVKTQGCLRNIIPVSVYTGGEVRFNQMGAEYSIPSRFIFPGTKQTTFRDVQNKIYKALKLSADHFSLNIEARYNAASTDSFFFTLLPINDEGSWQLIFEMAVSGMNWHLIELYVKPVLIQACRNANSNLASSSGISSAPHGSIPMHTTSFQTMPFDFPVQGFCPGCSLPVPNQTCESYNSNPTLTGTSSMGRRRMRMHVNPYQNMPYELPAQNINSNGLPSSNSGSSQGQNYKLPVLNPSPTDQGSLCVNATFESKDHLESAIKDFHTKATIEITVKKDRKTKLLVRCKSQICEWMLYATPTGVGSNWVIKTCPHPHTCRAPASKLNHDD